MIYANYYIQDIFKHEQFISCLSETHTADSIKTAFKAIKKYNATIFIDVTDKMQVRYELKNAYSDANLLERTVLSFANGVVTDESAPILIDYRTALKDELEKAR